MNIPFILFTLINRFSKSTDTDQPYLKKNGLFLKKIRRTEYLTLIRFIIANYARAIETSTHRSKRVAREFAKSEIYYLLDRGFETPNHTIFSIYDSRKQKTVGYIWLKIDAPNKEAFICDFYIYPAYRRCGYGGETLKIVDTMLQKKKIANLYLSVFSDNENAIHLYTKNKFTVVKQNMWKKIP